MDEDLIGALRALSEPIRLRILGRLAAGGASVDELSAELHLPLAVVVRQVAMLRRFGLVGPPGRAPAEVYVLRLDTLQGIGRALEALTPSSADSSLLDSSLSRENAKVLRGYLEDGRLTTIPAQERKRRVVLEWLCARVFTEDRDYPEKEVNQRLGLFHPDVASLRRYMVDAGLVARDRGLYRRVEPMRPFVAPGE